MRRVRGWTSGDESWREDMNLDGAERGHQCSSV